MNRPAATRLLSHLTAFAAVAGLAFTASTSIADDEGVPVEVRVLDPEGNPIPTAVVRHPQEEERHRVNTVTGSWKASVLYLPTGEDMRFEKGMELELEVSAPGWVSETVRYIVRKRKNVILVTLHPMESQDENADPMDEPLIQFGRDRPIDGIPIDEPPSL